MKSRALFIAALLLCSIPAGPLSADQNVMCIAIDADVAWPCTHRVNACPFTPLDLYLIVANPTGYWVGSWECQVEIESAGSWSGDWTIANDGLNVGSGIDYIVGTGFDPLRPGPGGHIILMSTHLIVHDDTVPLEIYLRRVPGSSSFDDGPGYAVVSGELIACSTPADGYGQPDCVVNDPDGPPGYQFAIDLLATTDRFYDEGHVAATRNDTHDGFDPDYDTPLPPVPFGDYLSTCFVHPEWDLPLGERFVSDYRTPFDPEAGLNVWPFEVATGLSDTVSLAFGTRIHFKDTWGLFLRDAATDQMIDLQDAGLVYDFVSQPDTPRALEILVGPEDLDQPIPAQRPIPDGWSLVGLPLTLSPDAVTIRDVFLDESVGSTFVYANDPYWGYYECQPDDEVERGQAYWLGVDAPFDWSYPEGISDMDSVTVQLSHGWNLVGYPLRFPTGLDGVTVISTIGRRWSWQEAAQLGAISARPFAFDTSGGAYADVESFSTWEGYWIACYHSSVTLVFDLFDVVPPATSRTSAAKAGPGDWSLRVMVDGRPGGIVLGVAEAATDGFDAAHDLPHPPPTPASEQPPGMRFVRPAWDHGFGEDFVSDVRAPGGESYEWSASLTAPGPGRVELGWDATTLPADTDLEIVLPALDRCVVPSMRGASSVVIDVDAAPTTVVFRTTVGAHEPPSIPLRHAVTSHPNPFNPSTEITLRTAAAGEVGLEIYDTRGRRVRTYALGELPAGVHAVAWRGRDDAGREVAGGTYFARLMLDGARTDAGTKLTLVR